MQRNLTWEGAGLHGLSDIIGPPGLNPDIIGLDGSVTFLNTAYSSWAETSYLFLQFKFVKKIKHISGVYFF